MNTSETLRPSMGAPSSWSSEVAMTKMDEELDYARKRFEDVKADYKSKLKTLGKNDRSDCDLVVNSHRLGRGS